MSSRRGMLFFILLLLLGASGSSSIGGYSAEDLTSELSIRALFHRWCTLHAKSYSSNAERESRYSIFKHKLHHIHAHNTQQPPASYWLGLNAFSDMSSSEISSSSNSIGSSIRPAKLSKPVRSAAQLSAAPASIDWRSLGAVTAVKNSRAANCSKGSWAFATADAVESVNQIATGELLELSAQQLLDCEKSYGGQGCKDGQPQYALMYLGDDAAGLMAEAQYPTTGRNQTCEKKNGYVVSIDGYDNVWSSAPSDDSDIVEMVAKQPVTALIDSSSTAFQSYKGGVFKGPCSNTTIDLAVVIVGYGSQNGDDYWIIKNSWGSSWGENGYMKLQRGKHGLPVGRCAINSFVWYPLKNKAPASVLLQRDLIGSWKLDDKSGSSVRDSSLTSAHCTITGGATWSADGLTFNGAGKVFCGNKASMCGQTAFSVSAWVKFTSSSTGVIIQQRGPSGWTGTGWTTDGYNGEYMLYVENGKPTFWVWGDGREQFLFSSPKPINDNRWHHVLAIRDGKQGRLYVDGSLEASASGDLKNLVSNIPVYIGYDGRDNIRFFAGTLSRIAIYKRALSEQEIKQLSSPGAAARTAME